MNDTPTTSEETGDNAARPEPRRTTNVRPGSRVNRTADIAPHRRDMPRRSGESAKTADIGRTLTVGPEIELSGQISACDRLVVEGRVEADLTGAKIIEIHAGGSFKGSAIVDEADISGEFEGDLTGTRKVIIRAGGRVRGNVTYGSIIIEAGGVIIGALNTGDVG